VLAGIAIALAVATGFACNAASFEGYKESVAHKRSERLAKTINIWRWFAREQLSSPWHYANYLKTEELKKLREWGFTAVRLPVREPFLFASRERSEAAHHDKANVHAYMSAIKRIQSAGLAVVVDFHGKDRVGMEADARYRNAISRLWGELADSLRVLDPEMTFFEMLNEPRFIKRPEDWYEWQEQIAVTIRSHAPAHTIIATAVEYSDPQRLAAMHPLPDSNVIYTFHTYDPIVFAHQGADFFRRRAEKDVLGLPWPSIHPSCRGVAEKFRSTAAKRIGNAYCEEKWDRQRLAEFLQPAFSWGKRWNVPIFVGEFGVRLNGTDSMSRARWLSDAVSIFAENGVPWALWSYDDCYGLALKVDGNCPVSRGVDLNSRFRLQRTLRALGVEAGFENDTN